MTATLWHIELSHYSEKARWALDYKRVPHRLRAPMPGVTKVVGVALTRGTSQRFPVLQLDGRAIHDSTAIIAALEAHTPDPPLYPVAAAERERALALEEFFDEEMAPEVRLFGWEYLMRDGKTATGALFGDRHPVQARMMRAGMPLTRAVIRADYGIDPDAAARARTRIVAAVDRLESELGGRDYLVGDAFSVADLAAAALLTPLLQPPERPFLPSIEPPEPVRELADEIQARPGGQWVFEMYRRHRGDRAKVTA